METSRDTKSEWGVLVGFIFKVILRLSSLEWKPGNVLLF